MRHENLPDLSDLIAELKPEIAAIKDTELDERGYRYGKAVRSKDAIMLRILDRVHAEGFAFGDWDAFADWFNNNYPEWRDEENN